MFLISESKIDSLLSEAACSDKGFDAAMGKSRNTLQGYRKKMRSRMPFRPRLVGDIREAFVLLLGRPVADAEFLADTRSVRPSRRKQSPREVKPPAG